MAAQDKDTWTFMAAMLDAFKKSGQTTAQFADEIKQLSDEDRKWYRAELAKAGYKGLE